MTPPELLATPSTVALTLGFSVLEPARAALPTLGEAARGQAGEGEREGDGGAALTTEARAADAVAKHVERVRQSSQGLLAGKSEGGERGLGGVGGTEGGDADLEKLYHPELKHPVRHIKLPRWVLDAKSTHERGRSETQPPL